MWSMMRRVGMEQCKRGGLSRKLNTLDIILVSESGVVGKPTANQAGSRKLGVDM